MDVNVASLAEELHLAIAIDTTQPVCEPQADVQPALVRRKPVCRHIHRVPVEVAALLNGKVSALVIEPAPAGDVGAVGPFWKQVDHRIDSHRKDVRISALPAARRNKCARELVVHELEFAQQGETLEEVQPDAAGKVATPSDIGGIVTMGALKPAPASIAM